EIPDVLLGSPSRDRADAPVGRVARRAHEQAVAGVLGVAAGALGRARRPGRLTGAWGHTRVVTMAPADGVAAGVEPPRRRAQGRVAHDAAPARAVGPRAAAGDGPRPAARGARGAVHDRKSALRAQASGANRRVGDAGDAVDVARVTRRRRAVALGRRGGARVGDGLRVAGTIATAREARPRNGEPEREGGEG